MYDLSIIIPVYNTEKYLSQCLDSVITKINNNMEIILIDDGSIDSSPLICDEYALKYENVRTIHKKNGGLSDARNAGIEAALGKYIMFLDSDDYWDQDANIIHLLSFIVENDIELLFFFFQKYYQKSDQYVQIMPTEIEQHFIFKERVQIIELLTKLNPFPASACTKIIKTEIIHKQDLKFLKGFLSEDVEWLFRLVMVCNLMCIVYDDFYIYRQQRENSITQNVSDQHINNIYYIIESNVAKIQNEINDLHERQGLFSLLAYQYTILMGKILDIKDKNLKRELYLKTKRFKWLLKYDLNPKVKKVRLVESIVGVDLTMHFLNIFLKLKSKYIIK